MFLTKSSSKNTLAGLRLVALGALAVFMMWLGPGLLSAQTGTGAGDEHNTHDMEMEHHHEHTDKATESMTPHQQHMGPHMKWTTLWPANPNDAKRADEIVRALRESLAKYKDYRVALADGYELPPAKGPQPHYHFTSKKRGFNSAFRFDPAEPTSLLYKKTTDGYELEGAMYTAPKRLNEDALNERVPLSVAQWHAHVNICMPPQASMRRGDWKKFGFHGSIATEQECQQAEGQFRPQIYGWMLHVYPYQDSPEKIWTH